MTHSFNFMCVYFVQFGLYKRHAMAKTNAFNSNVKIFHVV